MRTSTAMGPSVLEELWAAITAAPGVGAAEISWRLVAGEPLGRRGVQVGGAGPRKVQARAGPVTRTVWRVLEICHGDQHLSEDNRPEDLPQG